MIYKSVIFSVFILISNYSCTPATDPDSSPAPTAAPEQILQKYYQALGGYEKIKGVETIAKNGYYIEPAYAMVWPATLKKKRPNYRVIGLGPDTPDQIREGYDGSPWEHHKGEEVIRSQGESAKAILVANDFDYPFVDAAQKGHQLEALSDTVIHGLSYHRLRVTMDLGTDVYTSDYFFNSASGLLEIQRKMMPIHARGPEVEIFKHYSDFREVAGVLYPHSTIERRADDGTFLNSTVWESIRGNIEIPLAEFSPIGDPETTK